MPILSFIDIPSRAIYCNFISGEGSLHFYVLLKNRSGAPITDFNTNVAEKFALRAETLQSELQHQDAAPFAARHFVRLRGIWFDDKNGCLTAHIDYLHDPEVAPTLDGNALKRHFEDGNSADFSEHQAIAIATRIIKTSTGSDWFHSDGDTFYNDELRSKCYW